MNKSLKLILYCIASFILGSAITRHFYAKAWSDREQEALLKFDPKAFSSQTRLPDVQSHFDKESDLSKDSKLVTPHSYQPIIPLDFTGSDYVSMSQKVRAFEEVTYVKVIERFEKYFHLEKKVKRNEDRKEMLQRFANDTVENKRLWYKALISDEQNKLKIVFLTNYYPCSGLMNTVPTSFDFKDLCYYTSYYIFFQNKWDRGGRSSSVDSYAWRDSVSYLPLDLNHFGERGELIKSTDIHYMVLPTPENNVPLEYLKYKGGKYVWEQGPDLIWDTLGYEDFRKQEASMEKLVLNSNKEAE